MISHQMTSEQGTPTQRDDDVPSDLRTLIQKRNHGGMEDDIVIKEERVRIAQKREKQKIAFETLCDGGPCPKATM